MDISTNGFYKIFCSILLLFQILIIPFVHCAKNRTWEGTLVFHEDFDGDVLNSRWEKITGCEGKGHQDTNLECFTESEDNVRVRNGILYIEAMREDYIPKELWARTKARNYTSGRVKMTNDLGFKYGSFVVRARLAKGSHMLSSIYLQPAYQDHDNCKYEEIDVVQGRGQRTATAIMGALFGRQWNHASVRRTEKVVRYQDLSKDFHEFAVVWKKHRMEWYTDGVLMNSLRYYYYSDWLLPDDSNLPCNANKKLFQQELQLNLALSVGGTMFPEIVWGELTEETARNWTKPTLEIDWVKIYQTQE